MGRIVYVLDDESGAYRIGGIVIYGLRDNGFKKNGRAPGVAASYV